MESIQGTGKGGRRFVARFEVSAEKKRTCITCGGVVRRSWVTDILHRRCRFCRYLVMMYGPSIRVTKPKKE